ncbi:MAG: MBOAT family protein [Flavobacterium sp.]|nr:MBOAT family protein [Flavobacterium sp.]
MLFNSINFALFFPLVFILYWLFNPKSLKFQNLLLLVASFYFYSCWDWRFLFLLIFSILLDYYSGIQIEKSTSERLKKFWFWLSIGINLGFLGVFKYFNFFATSFADLLSSFGFQINTWSLNVILPVGISFYTFHGLSYVIDIYKKRITAEKNFVQYAVFVSFFPLLVAGPIERATHLLPQIKKQRKFNYAQVVDGLRQILWGLFKKIVIADNCAEVVNLVYSDHTEYTGSVHFIAAIFFAFQIYGDFSGYSDIALGTSRLLGIELLKNFSFPYFSRDIAEFWRRWHISLSSWFKDYLYIPLGGSKGGKWMQIRNTFAIFLVSGFWHGANWTFIFWGFLNALFIMPSIIFNTNRNNIDIVAIDKLLPSLKEFFQIAFTFSLTVLAWIFFRAENLTQAFAFIDSIFSFSFFYEPNFATYFYKKSGIIILLIIFFIIIEWIGRKEQFAIAVIGKKWNVFIRWSFYSFIIFLIGAYMNTEETPFIYFQF